MLKFLVIFFSIIYLGGLLGRWFLKKWVSNIANQQPKNENNNSKKEGEVTINANSNDNTKKNNIEGEYVDYEEVE